MAMGTRRKSDRQQEFWIPTAEIVQTPGSVFYTRLNEVLDKHKFDKRMENRMARFVSRTSRPLRRRHPIPGVGWVLLVWCKENAPLWKTKCLVRCLRSAIRIAGQSRLTCGRRVCRT